MDLLKGFQKKYLKGLAHNKKPVVFIGQKGFTDSVHKAIEDALNKHELIKVKFNDCKEKSRKKEIVQYIKAHTGCDLVGVIGHIATLYRRHKDPEKRKIDLPFRDA